MFPWEIMEKKNIKNRNYSLLLIIVEKFAEISIWVYTWLILESIFYGKNWCSFWIYWKYNMYKIYNPILN